MSSLPAAHPEPAAIGPAHWEHGYRGHGLWVGNARLGYVGLGPAGAWDGVYRWHVDVPGSPGTSLVEGEARSLRVTQRMVERSAAGREVAWPWRR